MSNLKTLEKLQERLDKELAWRKKELSLLKSNIADAQGEVLNTVLRSGISLLYAHWEGYIKIAARSYLEFLTLQEYKLSDLKDNFLLLHLKKAIISVRNSNKTSTFTTLLDTINSKENKIFKVKYMDKEIITTNSNLNYDTLSEILFSLGLPTSEFETKKHFIDKKLLDVRNKIAHGEYISLVKKEDDDYAKSDFDELYKTIINLMDKFKELIITACIDNSYLKSKETVEQ